jgi:hypothetical protein
MMKKLILFFLVIILSNLEVYGDPIKTVKIIETPSNEERNNFMIQSPEGWGYRTFKGKNGLIAVLWPSETSFNHTDTAIFIFLQNNAEKLPDIPDNINLFTEKCPSANFKFATLKEKENETLSIAETYFSGRCGRTMILFKANIDNNYTLIIALVSAQYVSQKQFADTKAIATAYKKEIKRHTKMQTESAALNQEKG